MKVENLYRQLQKINEAKGYYFNRDMEKTMFLLESLLKNKERYGYMCCPCRLAQEDAKADRDIICPCDYREADVREFGACYCQLYVAKQWNDGTIPEVYIPERRPEEKS
jgi:ferredoxin-thioredoxin reductase catalytic chain